ncbi:MAG TPA: transketolase family protein [Terracidiphilus sp.]|nr:transketolase family protein [Terracidiphilus sp.]
MNTVIAPNGESQMTQLYDCRDSYAEALGEMAEKDDRVCVVINDSLSSAKMKDFKAKYPARFVNVGIAEQNMVGVGNGLANGGMLPYLCGASCFLTARAMEQIKVDLAYSNANVRICGMSSGMAYGQLGPTHHSIEDLAWTRILPNMTVIVPADPIETASVMRYSLDHAGPMFLRISRIPVRKVHPDDYKFELGKAAMLRQGRDVAIIANGVVVSRALDAAEILAERGVQARVLNMSTIKPLDRESILKAAQETGGIVTAEEAFVAGGLGGAVAEVLAVEHPTRMRMIGVPDAFAPTGTAEFLMDHFGISAQGITKAALELVRPQV